MGLFRDLGERVEKLKRQAADAASETYVCAECGAEFATDYEACPKCGSENVERVE